MGGGWRRAPYWCSEPQHATGGLSALPWKSRVNRGDVHGDPTKRIQGQSGDTQVRHARHRLAHKGLIMSARDSRDKPGDGAMISLAKEGHERDDGLY